MAYHGSAIPGAHVIRFSVVIPLYNKAAYIDQAVRSILSQTVKDFELIIVDDGSTDDSVRRVEKYTDDRIRLIRQDNQGVSAARNKGVAESKEDYIAFLDADDVWLTDFLKKISDLIVRYPGAGMYATSYCYYTSGGREWPIRIHGLPKDFKEGLLPNFFKTLYKGTLPFTTSSVCVPRIVLSEVGGFPEGLQYTEDIYVWSKIVLQYPIAFTTATGIKYCKNAQNSACHSFLLKHTDLPFGKLLRQAIADGKIAPASIRYAEESIARYTYLNAMRCLLAGQPLRARKWTAQVHSRRPVIHLKTWLVKVLSLTPYPIVQFFGKLIWRVAWQSQTEAQNDRQ